MCKRQPELIITEQFLNENPTARFVFGDNLLRMGTGGGAALRHHPQAFGFCTKKAPDYQNSSYYKPEEYRVLFFKMLDELEEIIRQHPEWTFYVSKVGAGLANRYRIWDLIIRPNLEQHLSDYPNVVLMW